MADAPLRVERAGDAVWCTLDRPPLNLLEPGLIRAVRAAFDGFAADRATRVVVLTGGGRAFTAGMDVRVLRDLDTAGAKELITLLHDTIDAVHRAPCPVIAAVNGACLGAGFELALACDLRVASAGAPLGLPEVRVGVPSVILTGEPITAERAHEWGLVNDVVPAERLRATVQARVDTILACGPEAVRLQKELIVGWRATDLRTAVRSGIDAFTAAYATDEPFRGMSAFLEKRPPKFRSRR